MCRLTETPARFGGSASRTVVPCRDDSPLSTLSLKRSLAPLRGKTQNRPPEYSAHESGNAIRNARGRNSCPIFRNTGGKRPGNGNALRPHERTEREKALPATRLCRGKGLSETVFYTAPIVCPSRRADSPPRRPCRSGKARSECRRRYYGTWPGRTRCRSSCFPTCGRSSGRPVRPGR